MAAGKPLPNPNLALYPKKSRFSLTCIIPSRLNMLILPSYAPPLQRLIPIPFTTSSSPQISIPKSPSPLQIPTKPNKQISQFRTYNSQNEIIDIEAEDVVEEYDEDLDETPSEKRFRGKQEEIDYDKDPEFAEILGSCFDDPVKAQARVEDRIRKKRNKILQPKTGSATPMKVVFNKFDFSDSYLWFEFCNTPLANDISLISDTIRSWHIIGRLGGCNSMNMQLSQAPLDKRPSYDPIQGANVNPTTFYNIGDFEVQDNLARVWMDIGTSEPLLLDVLINALTQISSDYVGIKQLVFGGSEFENWKENLNTEASGYSVHKI